MADDRQDSIRQRAHEIWEREGRPHGQHERHWHQAAGEVAAEQSKAAGTAAKRKPAPAKTAKPAVVASATAKQARAAAKPAATKPGKATPKRGRA